MSHEQEALRLEVNQLCEQFPAVVQRIEDSRGEIARLSSSIEDARSEIGDLVEQRRYAPRQERWYYRDQISDAKDRKYSLIQEIKAEKSNSGSLRTERSELLNRARNARRRLEAAKKELSSGLRKLGTGLPQWALEGVTDMRSAVSDGKRFVETQLNALNDGVFNAPGSFENGDGPEPYLYVKPAGNSTGTFDSDDNASRTVDPLQVMSPQSRAEPDNDGEQEPFVYLGVETDSWGSFDPKDGTGLAIRLLEPPHHDQYLSADNSVCLPSQSYTLFDTIDIENARTEVIGTRYATAVLKAEGHRVVLELGGPGMPDIISLDASNDLWISEVKGTDRSTPLYQSGLKRPIGLFENSREWLQRKGPSVLAALDRALASEGSPSSKEQLQLLSMRFSEAVKKGFDPSSYKNQVIQVGLSRDSDYLRPPVAMQSEFLDQYCKAVMPERLVQVDVMSGSKESELFEG